ncbi:MAG: hypothetical protein JXA99_16645 [Candidatus Lokiarchaeota archaeon]|nr:hypothetical protein [Candidatus Lokiarchaeota archaeon]
MIINKKVREIPGWGKDAPVPICIGGDYRALTFCCKPGYYLSSGDKCKRDERLAEICLSIEKYIMIKEEFSNQNNWNSDLVCFGSLSYCCMRRRGCSKRDIVLETLYPNLTMSERLELYFENKKILSKKLLESSENEKIKELLDLF